jgi:ribosomal RNA-processing protein 12
MIIPAGDGSDEEASTSRPAAATRAAQSVEGDAYLETLVSTDGFTRGPTGKVKFHKDTKKRRAAEMEAGLDDGDAEMVDVSGLSISGGAGGGGGVAGTNAARRVAKKQKQKEAKLGSEFKAKVGSLCCALESY